MSSETTPPRTVLCPVLDLHSSTLHPDLYSSTIAHFSSIPWTRSLLLGDSIVPFIPLSVNPPADQTSDQFLGQTLASPRALKKMLCLFRSDDASHARDPTRPILRASSLYDLGEGLIGYEGIVHGGFIMTMMDEAMGSLHDLNRSLRKSGPLFAHDSLTAGLEIKLLKPVKVGQVVVDAWIEGSRGRKIYFRCEMRDQDGIVLARCSSTWVTLVGKL